MDKLGPSVAFQIFSGISFCVAFCYYLIYKLYLLPIHEKLETFKKEVCNMPIKTVSMKEHRRLSMRYDKNVVFPPTDESNQELQMVVRESTLNGDDVPYRQGGVDTYATLGKNIETYPNWSDEDEGNPSNTRVYPTLEGTPSSSTPYKYRTSLPACDVSKVMGGNDQETAVTYLEETQTK